MATLFWISEQQGPLVFQTGNEGEENVWRSRDVVRERPHLQMQERLSSEQRTSSWHTPCLGVSCPALLRPTDTLNPVSFKNKNKKKKNRRRKRGQCWAFSHKSPGEWKTPSMQAASLVREQIQRCHTAKGPVKSHVETMEREMEGNVSALHFNPKLTLHSLWECSLAAFPWFESHRGWLVYRHWYLTTD